MIKKITPILLFILLILSTIGHYFIAASTANNNLKEILYNFMVFEILMLLISAFRLKQNDKTSWENKFLLFYALNPILAIVLFGSIAALDQMAGGLN